MGTDWVSIGAAVRNEKVRGRVYGRQGLYVKLGDTGQGSPDSIAWRMI